MIELIRSHIEDSIDVKKKLLEEQKSQIESAGLLLAQALESGNKILLCGNGGSAADAQHIAAELLIRYKTGNDRPALPALSLSSDASTVTACANDYGFDQLYSRQIEGLGNKGDILIAITTSGNSQNIIEAVAMARKKEMKVILFTGAGGGSLLKTHPSMIDVCVCVPSQETARIQECHILVGHILCAIVEKKLYNMI